MCLLKFILSMKVAVVGTGYVGLVTGTCFAEMGNSVTCVDIDEKKIKLMKSGSVPIYEPGLEELFQKNIRDGRLSFTTSLDEGIKEAEVIFLALPTPPAEDGSADLKYILGVALDLGKKLDHYAVVVNKSTVPVGTAEKVRKAIAQNGVVEFDVVSNPEFLKEGFAVSDFMNPDRIVIGAKRAKARDVMLQLYEPLTNQGSEMFLMDEKSAEMTKYAANAFLATKISFMNEIANLCELVGADVDNVRHGIGSDTRIGKKFLYPGIGYGGSCFPKDVMALHRTAMENDYDFKILDAVTDVNNFQKRRILNKLVEYFEGKLEGKTIAIWGLAFKAETDDIREAPSLEIITGLTRDGAKVHAYDPEAMGNVKRFFNDNKSLTFFDDEYAVLKGVDALVIATEWNIFKNPNFKKMKEQMAAHVIFDGRNIYDLETIREQGFEYYSVGRKDIR
jgi:UDPglucose 6-dehydrogenase